MASRYRIGIGLRPVQIAFTRLASYGLRTSCRQILTVTRGFCLLPRSPRAEVEITDWLAGRTPRELAGAQLSSLPDRWAHTQTAAAQAERAASTVAATDRELLLAAAWLHDIGYAAPLNDTGFHPVDGARYLRGLGAPMRLAALVAHHSEAELLAEARGLLDELEPFPRERSPVADALSYADMSAGPTGQCMTITARLADIRARHAAEPPRLKAARIRREPVLRAAAARVQRRMRQAGQPLSHSSPARRRWSPEALRRRLQAGTSIGRCMTVHCGRTSIDLVDDCCPHQPARAMSAALRSVLPLRTVLSDDEGGPDDQDVSDHRRAAPG